MLDHINKGCPTNSQCSKELGMIRLQWENLFKEKKSPKEFNRFIKKNGFPLKAWVKTIDSKDSDVISWHSQCETHRKEEINIRTAELFHKKSFKNNILYHKIFIEKEGGIQKYIVPRNESPLFLDGNDLYFTIEEAGSYYGLKVDKNNTFNIVQTKKTDHFVEATNCSEALKKKFISEINDKNLYMFMNCRLIWNKKKKSYSKYITGKACP